MKATRGHLGISRRDAKIPIYFQNCFQYWTDIGISKPVLKPCLLELWKCNSKSFDLLVRTSILKMHLKILLPKYQEKTDTKKTASKKFQTNKKPCHFKIELFYFIFV